MHSPAKPALLLHVKCHIISVVFVHCKQQRTAPLITILHLIFCYKDISPKQAPVTSVSVHDQNAKVWKIGDYLERIGKINITVTILNDNFYFFYWGGGCLSWEKRHLYFIYQYWTWSLSCLQLKLKWKLKTESIFDHVSTKTLERCF